ncbi:glycosyltransferase [Leucobacter coleopterorum]|uniref:Glycosyltransferase n=1 Tax=Leucobacter coleopterorum TaxID=2714933 RepID=A0ABX6JYJ3_9MICO|nr:glycosyltransferase [Leucobacter coleopterorum]QIM19307.1 glycosyltransferase [Leucobacter coleopterorum]
MIQQTITHELNRPQAEWDLLRPHTTLIVACYRVEKYLPAFLDSLEQQDVDHAGYELIFVNDGCPQGSDEVVREWMQTSNYAVRLVSKPNGGVASARNIGLGHARGAWVSHPDPDDRLDSEYLITIETARDQFPQETMFAARAILSNPAGEETGHTLDARYAGTGTSIIDLNLQPRLIHTLGGVVFFKRDLIESNDLRFQESLLQSSDTDLIGHFLLCNEARYVIVPGARYFYMRRSDGSSIVSTHSGNMARYASLFANSHMKMLERAGEDCPPWLANLLLYFVFMLFRRNRRLNTPVDLVSKGDLATIRELLQANLRRIGTKNISRFDLFAIPIEFRMAWLAAVEKLPSSPVEHLSWHPATKTRKVAVYTSSPVKPLDIGEGGRRRGIIDWKSRTVEFLGGVWIYQHVFRISAASPAPVRLECFEKEYTLEFNGNVLNPSEIRARSGLEPPLVVQPKRPRSAPKVVPPSSKLRRCLKATGLLRGPNWVFLADTQHETLQCELLYKETARAWRGARACFVAEQDSPRFTQLEKSGFRVLAAGSRAHFEAMQTAQFVVTPQIGALALDPFPGQNISRAWRIVLLPEQAQDRLAYRQAAMDHAESVPVSTSVEFDRLAGRYSRTSLLTSDVVLTGLPRHDLLERLRTAPFDIAIAPDWPHSLPHPSTIEAGSLLEIQNTTFVRSWVTFLASESLRQFIERTGRRAKLLLPQGVPSSLFSPPKTIEVVSGLRSCLEAIAASAVLLTDFSPHARDAAYLGRPTVYLQEDPGATLGAPDSPLAQAFAFRNEGFGPVVRSHPEAVEALEALLQATPTLYQDRIREAFQFRDGKASARIVQELQR